MNKRAVRIVLCSLAIIILCVCYFFRFELEDAIKNIFYEPTADVLQLSEQLELTPAARSIFFASRPILENSDSFNSHCTNENTAVSVLGCYSGQSIYIYNIDSDELKGIVESTAAHELLHAAWNRLSIHEKNQLSTVLWDVYQNNSSMLSSTLENYAKDSQLDELHSRIGTQIADLPDALERYYAKYFSDRTQVIGFYEAYVAPFSELKQSLDQLSDDMNALKTAIDADTATYVTRAAQLTTDTDNFNTCAKTAGCYTAAAFNQRRAELVAEQNSLGQLYRTIEKNVTLYNEKVAEYNSNILHTQTLNDIINSTKERTE